MLESGKFKLIIIRSIGSKKILLFDKKTVKREKKKENYILKLFLEFNRINCRDPCHCLQQVLLLF